MKNKYKLDKKGLRKRKKECSKRLKSDEVFKGDEIAKIYETMYMIDTILSNDIFSNISPFFIKNKDKLSYFYSKTYKETSAFQREVVKKAHDIYVDNEKNYESPVLSGYMSFRDRINLIYTLFSFDTTGIRMCNLVFDYQKKLLYLNNRNQNLFFELDKTGIIKARKKDDIESFLVLAHELGHYYEFLIREKENEAVEFNSYEEIFSLFFELLSIDLLKEKNIITENERKDLLYNAFDTNLNAIKDYMFLLTQTDFSLKDKKYIKGLKFDVLNSFVYFYSFVIAADLYLKYKEDKDKVLNILKEIANNLDIEKEEEFLKYHDIDTTGKSLQKFLQQTK